MTLEEWRESKVVDRVAGDRAVRSDLAALAWHKERFGHPGSEEIVILWDQIEPLGGPETPVAPPRRRRSSSGPHA